MEAYIMPVSIVVVSIIAVFALMANYKAGGSSREQISKLIEQALLAKQTSDFEQSAMLYERALELIDNMRTIDEALLSECLVSYSTVLDRLGKRQDSDKHRTRLLSIWNSALEAGNEDLLTEVDYICLNAEFGAQTVNFANYYERLLAQREKTKPETSDVFINTVVIYSRLMSSLGEKQIASDLEAHADQLRAKQELARNPKAQNTQPEEQSTQELETSDQNKSEDENNQQTS